MKQTYIDIMIQSLNKKLLVLDRISEVNVIQRGILENTKAPVEDFDKTVEEKASLIEQMQQLDSGFEKLFERVQEELQSDKKAYAESIQKMQECIRRITDKSMEIQVQETRNKELMVRKFAYVKNAAKTMRTNSRVANNYYKNMMNLHYVDPQFMDNKK